MTTFPPFSIQVTDACYCYPDNSLRGTRKLHVACAGRERCNRDYRISRDHFASYGIEFVADGCGEVILGGKSWPLQPGTLFCYGPRTPHTITSSAGKTMTKYFVDFSGSRALTLLQGARLAPGQVVYTFESESFRAIFDALIVEGSKSLRASARICSAYLEVLVLKTQETATVQKEYPDRATVSFQRCKRAIDTGFLELNDLEDIAQAAHVSTAYLCRLFRMFGQAAPFQYLTRKRLSRAAELLVSQNVAIKTVALEVGYDDPYHFSRLFKHHFGKSPTLFAQLHRK